MSRTPPVIPNRKQWTDEELLALPEDGYKRELLDGEIVMSPGWAEHGRLIMRFATLFGLYVYQHKLGEVFDGQTGFRMKSGDLLSPDVSLVSNQRLVGLSTFEQFFNGAPDLPIEFVSAGERKKRVERKVQLYFENGARLVWLMEMRRRQVRVYHAATDPKILTAPEMLDGEDVVPGFTIPVADIFAGFDYGTKK
jgi:Uma2 family endonuclease